MSTHIKSGIYLLFSVMIFLLASCNVECPKCKGVGEVSQNATEYSECSKCDGIGKLECNYQMTKKSLASSTSYKCEDGYYVVEFSSGYNTGNYAGKECEKCDGEGEIDCRKCDGTGEVGRTKKEVVECNRCDGSGQVSKF